MKYSNILSDIPKLVDALESVQTEYAFQKKYVGQAISYLLLLKDILQDNENDETNLR